MNWENEWYFRRVIDFRRHTVSSPSFIRQLFFFAEFFDELFSPMLRFAELRESPTRGHAHFTQFHEEY
jgi:hypothetical protein